MLDLLDLAPDGLRGKQIEKEGASREERFNQIMSKLRERNALNEMFIKRYIKKVMKRRGKLPGITFRLNENSASNDDNDKEREEDEAQLQLENMKMTLQKTEGEGFSSKQQLLIKDSLKKTNHTLTEEVEEDDKIPSFPNIDFCSNHPPEISPNKLKPNFQNFKHDRQFNKYLKNVFFKEIGCKIPTKKIIPEQKEDIEPRRSQGRMKTEANSSKYQLSIKSLIFGSQDPQSEKKKEFKNEVSVKYRIDSLVNEKFKTMDKYEKDFQFQDDKLSSKNILPTIHNHQATKNRRFLENYIRCNNERLAKFQTAEVKSIALPTDSELPSRHDSPHRIGMSLRIQTIQIQKPF